MRCWRPVPSGMFANVMVDIENPRSWWENVPRVLGHNSNSMCSPSVPVVKPTSGTCYRGNNYISFKSSHIYSIFMRTTCFQCRHFLSGADRRSRIVMFFLVYSVAFGQGKTLALTFMDLGATTWYHLYTQDNLPIHLDGKPHTCMDLLPWFAPWQTL